MIEYFRYIQLNKRIQRFVKSFAVVVVVVVVGVVIFVVVVVVMTESMS